jgi:hypothetical protein
VLASIAVAEPTNIIKDAHMRLKRSLNLAMVFVVGLTGSGCASIRSTIFSYDGCQDFTKTKTHIKGVPTTLEVPTHLHVKVWRSRYGKASDTGFITFVKELETRKVEINPVKQKEIFAVDFKRPAAGTLKYKVDFDKDKQYIKEITNELDGHNNHQPDSDGPGECPGFGRGTNDFLAVSRSHRLGILRHQ